MLIGNIFFNKIIFECFSGNLIPHVTDHLPNFLVIQNLETNCTLNKKCKRDFTNFNLQNFTTNLENIALSEKLNSINDTNKMYDFFS